jgi:hypothetical protein
MKWINLLFIVSFLILGISLVGCGNETEAKWHSYKNPIYGYTISYPSGWELDDADMSYVCISKYPVLVKVCVSVDDYKLPLSERVEIYIESIVNGWDKVEIMHSGRPKLKWDWVLAYQYFWEGTEFYAQAYFLQSSNYTYKIAWDCSKDSGLYKTCQDIANTFTLH